MTTHDRESEFIHKIRDAFEAACPDVPLCKQKVADVFGSLSGSSSQLEELADLAFDLGLDMSLFLVKAP